MSLLLDSRAKLEQIVGDGLIGAPENVDQAAQVHVRKRIDKEFASGQNLRARVCLVLDCK